MKKFLALGVTAVALLLAATASAALEPGVYDPGATGCPTATYSAGVLHLVKNCPTATNAAAGADITGFTRPDVHLGLVHARQCRAVSGRFAAVRRCHDDRDVLPRLQQRDPDRER